MIVKDTRKWIYKVLGYCPYCRKYFRKGVMVHRRPTNYTHNHLNFLLACDYCQKLDAKQLKALNHTYFSKEA